MIYTCNHCRFTFRRTGAVEYCPDCGKQAVREASDKEKSEYKKNQDEYEKANKKNKE
jgi:uncharacterized Zn finger protein (UPF0148 family)